MPDGATFGLQLDGLDSPAVPVRNDGGAAPNHRGLMRRRTAFVTGASYGVGAATALALARDGFDVAVSATRVENLADTMRALADSGARTVSVVLDLRAPASIEGAFADVVA